MIARPCPPIGVAKARAGLTGAVVATPREANAGGSVAGRAPAGTLVTADANVAGVVVALIAIGDCWPRGVTVRMRIPTASSPSEPVANANTLVEGAAVWARNDARSSAATSAG